jgi:hypothetical protein
MSTLSYRFKIMYGNVGIGEGLWSRLDGRGWICIRFAKTMLHPPGIEPGTIANLRIVTWKATILPLN